MKRLWLESLNTFQKSLLWILFGVTICPILAVLIGRYIYVPFIMKPLLTMDNVHLFTENNGLIFFLLWLPFFLISGIFIFKRKNQ